MDSGSLKMLHVRVSIRDRLKPGIEGGDLIDQGLQVHCRLGWTVGKGKTRQAKNVFVYGLIAVAMGTRTNTHGNNSGSSRRSMASWLHQKRH